MTNWWTLSAVITEMVGALLIAQGLAGEKPIQWVRGRGTPRWDLSPDADLNYAAGATDAGIGFCVLLVGLVAQAGSAIDTSSAASPWLLAVPVMVGTLAGATRRRHRRARERAVIRLRLRDLAAQGEARGPSGASVVRGYSTALADLGRGPLEGEAPWDHLDRLYGTDAWVPAHVVDDFMHACSSFVTITDRAELGDVWLPWFVHRDAAAKPVRDLRRDHTRQVRVRDVFDDRDVASAMAIEETSPGGAPISHRGCIDDKADQWRHAKAVSPAPFPAFRTPEGPVLRDGCHRCCAVYLLDLPRAQITLELSDPAPGNPDTAPGPRRG